MTLWVEGPLSLLALTGCPLARATCCLLWCGLMIGIAASGNYGFFNLLTCVLATSLLDDSQWLPVWRPLYTEFSTKPWHLWDGLVLTFVVSAWALYTVAILSSLHRICTSKSPSWVGVEEKLHSLNLAQRYGLFARMTTTRDEVIIRELHELPPQLAERAVQDKLAIPADRMPWDPQKFWVELALPYKPGPLNRPPPVLLTHMPRLDWQMWFVSLTWARYDERPKWFQNFLQGLLERKPSVLRLVSHAWQHEVQKFALSQKPSEIRVTLEDYDYNPLPEVKRGKDERWECGTWWCRRHVLTDCEIHIR